MKKKAIEKIPYLTLSKISRKKGVLFVGVTAVKNIDHERHFFLEVYRNTKKTRDVPVVRIVCTKKDFGTYRPDTGEWSRQKIKSTSYLDGLIWNERRRYRTSEEMEKENGLQADTDRERIETIFKKHKPWHKERWWEYIEGFQRDIVWTEQRERNRRKYERRQQALDDRIANTPPLPEKEILTIADRVYFHEDHYLFYKKSGSWAKIACSKCGGVTDARWKDGVSYESQFQKHISEPREGQYGICPMCGAHGEWKCQGKVRSGITKTIHLFLGNRYKETGFVMRYIEVTKDWRLGLIAGEKGTEMYNSCEELSGVEVARAYFEEGKKTQIDYHKHNPYSGEDYWDDCNLYGMNNIRIESAPVLSQTYREMEGTLIQYCALEEYKKEVREVNAIEYMERYLQTPQIEMLVKMGLIGVVNELVRCRYGIVAGEYAKRPDQFLGIKKERVRQLIREKGDIELLKVMQMERRMDQNWTEEQIGQLAELGAERGLLTTATKYMTVQQFLNRVKKYAGCEYGTNCSTAVSRLKSTAQTYTDYLNMREALGYDLHNTVYQQPKNLGAAHQKMVMESNEKEMDERMMEVKVRFPMIRKNYRTLRGRYYYEDDSFLIRPARSAEEIVMEGRALHHCVGGNNYLEKHDSGTSYILMLRGKSEPEIPYITVEIDALTDKILQWYGAHDKKPDEKNMQKWLNQYITRLKCGERKETGQQAVRQVLQVAI